MASIRRVSANFPTRSGKLQLFDNDIGASLQHLTYGNRYSTRLKTYFGSATNMDRLSTPFTQGFAAIGLLYVSVKLFSFVRVLLSLFVLPGASVSHLQYAIIKQLY